MIKFLRLTSLRSRVARSIFNTFLFCALIPFIGLVIASYNQINTHFEAQSRLQLRAMAKSYGLDIFQRLTLLEAALGNIASLIDVTGQTPSEQTIKNLASVPLTRWQSLYIKNHDGTVLTLAGKRLGLPPEIPENQDKRLSSGSAVLFMTASRLTERTRIFLALKTGPHGPARRVVIGEVNPDYIWGLEKTRIIPDFIHPCVVSGTGKLLNCEAADTEPLPVDLLGQFTNHALGDYDWEHDGKRFSASFWTIPMRFEFDTPGWVVILRTSKEGIFASIADLQQTFWLSLLTAVGISILLAIRQIRNRLVPVEQLQEGTRRIAERDFKHQVKISSVDEFGELATALNNMAGELGQQFATIETSAEIERSVLSMMETKTIAQTIVARIGRQLHCELGTVTLFDNGVPANAEIFTVNEDHDGGWRPALARITWGVDPVAQHIATTRGIFVSNNLTAYGDIARHSAVAQLALRSCIATPLIVGDNMLGVVAIYSHKQRSFASAEIDFVRNLTAASAIALYNSQLYERTKQHAAELAEANQLKDNFLAVISHELRTPLNIMQGYLQMLQNNILGEITSDQANAVGTITHHSNDLLNIVDSIMEATKIQAGNLVVANFPINIQLFFESLKSACPLPTDKELDLQWHCPSDLPDLWSDEGVLKTILGHLMSNAIKFTERGTITVAAESRPEFGEVAFSVTDTGTGIPKEAHEKIFELFHQQDNSSTREFGGLGLGLYLVKHLSEAIGGTVTIDSAVGKGSMFRVVLPVKRDEQRQAAA